VRKKKEEDGLDFLQVRLKPEANLYQNFHVVYIYIYIYVLTWSVQDLVIRSMHMNLHIYACQDSVLIDRKSQDLHGSGTLPLHEIWRLFRYIYSLYYMNICINVCVCVCVCVGH